MRHLDRCGDDDALGAAVQVPLQRFGGQELAGAFQHQVHAHVTPGNLGCVGVGREPEPAVANADGRLTIGGDGSAPAALHAVELHEMGGGRRTALEFIEVYHLQTVASTWIVVLAIGGAHRSAQRQPADPAHSIDPDSHAVHSRPKKVEVSNASSKVEIYGVFMTMG